MREALETALAAAAAAGALVRRHAQSAGGVHSKSSAIDLVSETDIASGVEAVRVILAHDPDARFVVEEDEVYELAGAQKGDLQSGDAVWVIDPIDGTTSFLHGYPCYSVSIAKLEQGQPTVGVVYNVPQDHVYWATNGGGAFCDGQSIRTSEATAIEKAVIVTGFPYDRTTPLELQIATLSAFLRHPVQDIRRDGSAAIDCCQVAAGICDAYWEYSLKPWDVAAGVLIARESGATVTDVFGEPWTPDSGSVCIANHALHERMQDVILKATADLRVGAGV